MPRGKLHYEAYEEDDEIIAHWYDSHGGEHFEVAYVWDEGAKEDEDEDED